MRLAALLPVALLLVAGCASPREDAAPPPSAPEATDEGAWTSHAPQPTPRFELAVARVGSKIYAIAGLGPGLAHSPLVEAYDAATDAWERAPPYPFAAHHLAAVAMTPDGEADNGTIFAFGSWVGAANSASPLVYRLEPGAAAWQPAGTMPRARGAHAAVALGGEIWLLGGTGADGSNLDVVDVFDPATGAWRTAAPTPFARDHFAAAVLDGRIWVAGGREKTLDTTTNETWVYDPATDAWAPGPPMNEVRGGFALAPWRGTLVAAGGEAARDPRLSATAEILDPRAGAWTFLPDMERPRTGHGAAAWGGRVWIVGGGDPLGRPGGDAPESFG